MVHSTMAKNATGPAVLAARGPREDDLAGRSITSETNLSPLTIQVSRLLTRFAWSEARARAVAEIAFPPQGRASA